jgi:transcriptional regulator with XRE-family HTH domain
MDVNSLTANKIKELRLGLDKSQAEIAKDLGISNSAYERMENGKVDINLKMLERIANYYNISIPELITQKNSINYYCEHSQAIAIQQGNNQTFNLNVEKEDLEKAIDVLTKIINVEKASKP